MTITYESNGEGLKSAGIGLEDGFLGDMAQNRCEIPQRNDEEFNGSASGE
jgi:hypothetical protein